MMKHKFPPLFSCLLALTLIFVSYSPAVATNIPVTGRSLEYVQPASTNVAALAPFAASVATSGNPNLVAGLFAQGLFAAPIVQQPSSAPGFVSSEAEIATQFSMAAQYGTVALLAHNYLLGEQFFDVELGKVLSLVYGDGHVQTYRVIEVLQYQALSPLSPYSDFLDLSDPNGARISVTTLFNKVYTQAGKLVLQTCIEANGDSSWGRLFIIAQPEATFILPKSSPRALILTSYIH